MRTMYILYTKKTAHTYRNIIVHKMYKSTAEKKIKSPEMNQCIQ